MAGRRGNHEGTIIEDTARGGYRGAVTLADGSRRFVRGRTKADVIRRMAELHGHAGAGTTPPSGTMTVAEATEHWLVVVLPAKRRAPGTVEQYRWAAGLITEGLGRTRLANLTPERVEHFLARLAAADYALSSIRLVKKALGQILAEAERRGRVARNVGRLAYLPAHATPPAERDVLTSDEARRLLAAAADDRLAAYWVLALTSGARRGELLGLTWERVDLTAGTITIDRALRRAEGGGYEVGPTKTAGSVRTVRLSPWAVTALEDHKRRQRHEHMAAVRWSDTDLVFTSTVGTHLDPNVIRRSWTAITKSAGITGRVPHELRHTAGSLAVDVGVPGRGGRPTRTCRRQHVGPGLPAPH